MTLYNYMVLSVSVASTLLSIGLIVGVVIAISVYLQLRRTLAKVDQTIESVGAASTRITNTVLAVVETFLTLDGWHHLIARIFQSQKAK